MTTSWSLGCCRSKTWWITSRMPGLADPDSGCDSSWHDVLNVTVVRPGCPSWPPSRRKTASHHFLPVCFSVYCWWTGTEIQLQNWTCQKTTTQQIGQAGTDIDQETCKTVTLFLFVLFLFTIKYSHRRELCNVDAREWVWALKPGTVAVSDVACTRDWLQQNERR